MNARRSVGLVLTASAIAVLAMACSAGPSDTQETAIATSSQEKPTLSETIPEGPAPDFGVNIVSDPDLEEGEVTPIRSYSRAGAADELVIAHFTPIGAGCLAARASVVETESTVQIRLVTGAPTGAADQQCTTPGTLVSIAVPLTAPLGVREVLGS
ncbi:hypothetical protein GS467_18560 [Rhodococcus hoagii]|uniref:hypothetical protein n=1 Tax=Rhodococcus hoagii TaxID=43767 RepID=UPI0019F29EFB|nr:hypothetical protein [Prescottella equi]NKR26050.1 hypothetical protein [Prescottella equi]NKS23199.1 hypothetical protein [Prescottella equi]WJJ14488.1 hypothetical protein P9990_25170 [Prescottella equi]